jgi:hypothetical protein
MKLKLFSKELNINFGSAELAKMPTSKAFQDRVADVKKSSMPIPPNILSYVQRQSYDYNPTLMQTSFGFKQKLTVIADTSKLLIYLRDPIIAAIIQTRCNQAAEFAQPQKDEFSPGFIFERKDKKEIDDSDHENMEKLTDFILNCGLSDEVRDLNDENIKFEEFLRREIKDGFIYDTCAVERVPTLSGYLHHFLPVSAATIRMATDSFQMTQLSDPMAPNGSPQIKDQPDHVKIKYLQVIAEQKVRAFSDEDMILKFRNPINDFFTNGYPIGELDLLVNTITCHLNSDKRNRSVMENGFTSEGIINLKGEVDEEQLEGFRRAWAMMGMGPNAQYRVPIINSQDGVEFIKTGLTNKDMEFSNLNDYLIKVICAVFQIAPEEINFSSGGEGGGGGVDYNNLEKRLKLSKDKGLRPLLRFLESIINHDILSKLKDDWVKQYRFKFVGLDSENKMDKVDRLSKEVRSYKTINEARKEMGLKPLEDEKMGNLILDGSFVQMVSAQQMQQSQEAANALQGGQQNPGQDQGGAFNFSDKASYQALPGQDNATNFGSASLPFEKGNWKSFFLRPLTKK